MMAYMKQKLKRHPLHAEWPDNGNVSNFLCVGDIIYTKSGTHLTVQNIYRNINKAVVILAHGSKIILTYSQLKSTINQGLWSPNHPWDKDNIKRTKVIDEVEEQITTKSDPRERTDLWGISRPKSDGFSRMENGMLEYRNPEDCAYTTNSDVQERGTYEGSRRAFQAQGE